MNARISANSAFQKRRLPGDGLTLVADFTPAAPDRENCPTMIFMPGGGQTRRSWSGALRRAAAMGYPAMAVDLRGHGESDVAPDGDYHLRAMAADTIAVVDSLQGPVVLVGASRGGQTCIVAAADRSKRVRGLLLADIAPGTNRHSIDGIRDFMKASAAGFASAEEAAGSLGAYRGQVGAFSATRVARSLRRFDNGRLYWHWDPRFASDAYIDPPDERPIVDAAAAKLSCPVFLARGALSELVDDACVEHFQNLTPQVEIEILENAGHMLTDEQTAVFVDLIFGFLDRQPEIMQPRENHGG